MHSPFNTQKHFNWWAFLSFPLTYVWNSTKLDLLQKLQIINQLNDFSILNSISLTNLELKSMELCSNDTTYPKYCCLYFMIQTLALDTRSCRKQFFHILVITSQNPLNRYTYNSKLYVSFINLFIHFFQKA